VVAVLLLVPCVWQSHIMAGDLSSHLYNAWLAGQIEQGTIQTRGLDIAQPITNVLADWAIEPLLHKWGRAAAERIVVGTAVEVFFWGAFMFVAAAAGQRCWIIGPSLGMLTYGMIFHLGFLNFYIATGLSLWVMALLWHPRRPWFWLAIPVAALAMLAHPMPLAWAVAALLYVHGARRASDTMRAAMFVVGVCVLFAAQNILLALTPARWSFRDVAGLDGFLGLTGAGQLWLYGAQYLIVVAGVLIVWLVLFLERLSRGGLVADPLFHIWGLSLVAYVLLPAGIPFPQYRFPLLFMSYRLSLFIALLFCAMVGGGSHGRSLTRASGLLAAAFFAMLYLDAKSLNQVEAQLTKMISTLPPGARVATALQDSSSMRINGLIHIGSAPCIGHCWDYGNYEPSTGQFRVRAPRPNGVVVDDMRLVNEIEFGKHIVTREEAPIYSVCPSKAAGVVFEFRRLEAGEITCLVRIPATKHF